MLETIISSSLLIVILISLRYLLKGRVNPQLQYALWLLVAIRLLMPFPIFESSLSVLNIAEGSKFGSRIESPANLTQLGNPGAIDIDIIGNREDFIGNTETIYYATQTKEVLSNAKPSAKISSNNILYAVWLVGVIIIGLWFVLQNIWFYTRLRKTRKPLETPSSKLPVYLSRYVKSPCLFGFRPAIYIHPDSLADTEALNYILAHEETHYLHGDHLWAYLRSLCLTLHWFNPLVWWAAVLSRRDSEIACDQSTLNRFGDEHRKAYGNMLINMIEHRTKPSDLLLGATTMTSGKSGIKERITMIAQKPKMLLSTLFIIILILAVAVGCTFTGSKVNVEGELSTQPEEVALYDRAGITIAIPNEFMDQLLIDPIEYDDKSTLLMLYQKSTYEKYDGMGFLFGIIRFDEAQHEQFLSSDGSGRNFFAKVGGSYYGFFFATDVQAPDDYEEFSKLFTAVGNYVKSDMITRNGLTPYSDDEFFNKEYTYDSQHIFLNYYPYYAFNGSKDVVWTLTLSQPAKQGDTGIWCVERWQDESGNTYPYFPDENGVPSAKYYAEKQEESDSGKDKSWLDPKEVALKFVKKAFEHNPATIDSFSVSDNPV